MDCEQSVALISAALDGEASSKEQARLAEHLAHCPSCRALQQELTALHQACGTLDVDAPANLKQGILENLPAQRSAAGTGAYWRRWGAMAAAAALVVLAAWQLPRFVYDVSDAATLTAVPEAVAVATDLPMADTFGADAGSDFDELSLNSEAVNGAVSFIGTAYGTASGAAEPSLDAAQMPAAAPVPAPTPSAAEEEAARQYKGVSVTGDASLSNGYTVSQVEDLALPTAAGGAEGGMGGASLKGKHLEPSEASVATGAADAFDGVLETASEVPEAAPEVGWADFQAQLEPVSEGPWDFSRYSAVLTWPQGELMDDYPWQLQANGDTWNLVPASALADTLSAAREDAPPYEVRTQGEDLTADTPYILVILPADN